MTLQFISQLALLCILFSSFATLVDTAGNAYFDHVKITAGTTLLGVFLLVGFSLAACWLTHVCFLEITGVTAMDTVRKLFNITPDLFEKFITSYIKMG